MLAYRMDLVVEDKVWGEARTDAAANLIFYTLKNTKFNNFSFCDDFF